MWGDPSIYPTSLSLQRRNKSAWLRREQDDEDPKFKHIIIAYRGCDLTFFFFVTNTVSALLLI